MFRLRTYTLRSPEALQQYAAVHWARHLATFTTFGIHTPRGMDPTRDTTHRLVAMIDYPQTPTPTTLPQQIMGAHNSPPT